MKKSDDKVSLHLCTVSKIKKDMFSKIDISKFSFTYAAAFDYDPEQKYYSIEGTKEQFLDLVDVSKNLNKIYGGKITWALMATEDDVTMLISTNGNNNRKKVINSNQ